MAIIGIQTSKENPSFTKKQFLMWMPQYSKFIQTEDGDFYFKEIKDLVNKKIFYSIFGSDWKYAMSLGIAHYFTLISKNMEAAEQSGANLSEVSSGGTYGGILQSASIGDFTKTYKLDETMISTDESKFWNMTPYGAQLMALLKTKAIPSMFVVTSGPIRQPFPRRRC